MTIQTIKAKKLEWSDEKLMNWYEAKEYEKENNEKWRLPTLRELTDALYDKVPGFHNGFYLSNLECNDRFMWYVYTSGNGNGDVSISTNYAFKAGRYSVRFVREVKTRK